ncbi:MAG: SOS response-associated peptidase [Solirubrobacterales bacterium]
MCGRYTLTKPDWVEHDFHTSFPTLADSLRRPRFNVAPGQLVLALKRRGGGPNSESFDAESMRWGVEAPWKGGPPQMINARAEKLQSSRVWKSMLEGGRCAIPADGFYEWRAAEKKGARKQPFWFSRSGGEGFMFAGLSTPDPTDCERPFQCTIITVEPNELIEGVHDRMPAMLHRRDVGRWLGADLDDALALLQPFPSVEMTARAVGGAVGSAANDDASLIEPVNLAETVGADAEPPLF